MKPAAHDASLPQPQGGTRRGPHSHIALRARRHTRAQLPPAPTARWAPTASP